MAVAVSVGDEAPDFTLDGIDPSTGDVFEFGLSKQRPSPVVLVFYPADNSTVCTQQLAEYSTGLGEFARLGAEVVAVSPQSIESHRRFSADNGGFGFPLLADVGKVVGRMYGILGLLDLYRRSVFVIDGTGIVRWAHRFVGPGLGYRPVSDLVEAVEALSL